MKQFEIIQCKHPNLIWVSVLDYLRESIAEALDDLPYIDLVSTSKQSKTRIQVAFSDLAEKADRDAVRDLVDKMTQDS